MLLRIVAISAALLALVLTQISFTTVKAQPETAIEATVPEASVAAAGEPSAEAASLDFVIAGGDGYGATECLATAGQCGRIVADAWCESKGYARSLAYRGAAKEETTASTGRAGGEQAFVITCAAK